MITNFQGVLQQIMNAAVLKRTETNAENIKATKEEADSKIENVGNKITKKDEAATRHKERSEEMRAIVQHKDAYGGQLSDKEVSAIKRETGPAERRQLAAIEGQQREQAKADFEQDTSQYSDSDKGRLQRLNKSIEAAKAAGDSLAEKSAVRRANMIVAKNAINRLSNAQFIENNANYKEKNYGSFEDFPKADVKLAPQKTKQGV